MKRFISLLGINLVLVLLQYSFFRELFGANYNPNLVLALAFTLFFLDQEDLYLMSGFIGGIVLDLFGFSIVGLSALVITGTLILFHYIRRYLFRGWLSNIVLVILGQIVYVTLLSGAFLVTRASLQSGVSTLLVAFLLYGIIRNYWGNLARIGTKYT